MERNRKVGLFRVAVVGRAASLCLCTRHSGLQTVSANNGHSIGIYKIKCFKYFDSLGNSRVRWQNNEKIMC